MTLSLILTDQMVCKILVASSSTHGLAGPESDKDFQSVIVTPARDMFRPEFKYNCSAALIAASRVNT